MKAKLINNYMKQATNYILNTKKKVPTKKAKKPNLDAVIINEKVIPKPDHKHGYTNKLIKSIMTKEEFKKFNKWMCGQTCVMDDITKEIITYPYDVLRFLEMVRLGKPTYWD